jgi:hypothetical protein
MDEYGRTPSHPGYQDEERRAFERLRNNEGKKEWAIRRFGKSLAHIVNQLREDTVSDLMMADFCRKRVCCPDKLK